MKPWFQVARRDFRSPQATGLPHFATPASWPTLAWAGNISRTKCPQSSCYKQACVQSPCWIMTDSLSQQLQETVGLLLSPPSLHKCQKSGSRKVPNIKVLTSYNLLIIIQSTQKLMVHDEGEPALTHLVIYWLSRVSQYHYQCVIINMVDLLLILWSWQNN